MQGIFLKYMIWKSKCEKTVQSAHVSDTLSTTVSGVNRVDCVEKSLRAGLKHFAEVEYLVSCSSVST